MKLPVNKALLANIKSLLAEARQNLQQSINTTMVQSYWHIGRLIVEDEQQGKARAAYGKQQLAQLAEMLSDEFGKGFDARNLRNMRQFYQTFPIWNAVRTELSWTHCFYRSQECILSIFLALQVNTKGILRDEFRERRLILENSGEGE